MTPTLTDNERRQLSSLHQASLEIRSASIIARREKIEIKLEADEGGGADVYVRLLGNEPFRSLALAVRLVYQEGESANFLSVCNILYKKGGEEIRSRSANLRKSYLGLLSDPSYGISISDGESPERYDGRAVLDHWLNGIAFHQDAHRERDVRRLKENGALFLWQVQEITRLLAELTLQLDSLAATLLDAS